jgi:DNA replication ATP-dependent helicase Dna2
MVKKTILIGDHMQLPAVSVQQDGVSPLRHSELKNSAGLTDLRMSYFERMYRWYQHHGWTNSIGTLYEQGRMHEDIMQFPNEYVYKNHLRIADERKQTQKLSLMIPHQHTLLDHRLVFVPASIGAAERYARYNMDEVQIALDLVALWLPWIKEYQPGWTIGIITPFRAQIAAIHHQASVRQINLADVSVDTVERYQGGARDIILMTCAVNHSSMIERICSVNTEGIDRKLNVAVTRARQQFILIGAETVLQKMEGYRRLIDMSGRVTREQIR